MVAMAQERRPKLAGMKTITWRTAIIRWRWSALPAKLVYHVKGRRTFTVDRLTAMPWRIKRLRDAGIHDLELTMKVRGHEYKVDIDSAEIVGEGMFTKLVHRDQPTRIHWRAAVTFMSLCCAACYRASQTHRDLPCFTAMLCEQEGIAPVQRIPQWRNKVRGLVIQHYKREHTDWEVY